MTEPETPPPTSSIPPSEERPAESRPQDPFAATELPSCVGEPVIAQDSANPPPQSAPVPPPPPAFAPAPAPTPAFAPAPAPTPPPVPAASVAAALGMHGTPAPEREPAPSKPAAPLPPLYTPPPPEPTKVPGEPEPPNAPPPQFPPAGGPPPEAWAAAGGEPHRPSHEGWALAMHLSAVITLGFAWLLLGFVGPLILWLAKKDDDPELDWHGREALNFQLNLLLFWLAGLPLLLCCCVGLLVWAALPFYGIVLGLIASLKAADGKRWKYPLTLRLLND